VKEEIPSLNLRGKILMQSEAQTEAAFAAEERVERGSVFTTQEVCPVKAKAKAGRNSKEVMNDKRLRARDGCLGTCWRRRTGERPRKSTVSCLTSVDPCVSEWGNPAGVASSNHHMSEVVWWSRRRELKHLSTSRKRNQVRDTPSSGERNG
jgi:hypothetical protein